MAHQQPCLASALRLETSCFFVDKASAQVEGEGSEWRGMEDWIEHVTRETKYYGREKSWMFRRGELIALSTTDRRVQ